MSSFDLNGNSSGSSRTFERGPPPPPPPEIVPRSTSSSPRSNWNCEKCTLLNSILRSTCEVCGHPRKRVERLMTGPPARPPKLSKEEKRQILLKSQIDVLLTKKNTEEDNEGDNDDVEQELARVKAEKEKADRRLAAAEAALELARIKAEKEETERRLAAAEAELRRIAEEREEQTVTTIAKDEDTDTEYDTDEEEEKKNDNSSSSSSSPPPQQQQQSNPEDDMKRLRELVPGSKLDTSVRALYMKGARLLHPARGGDPKLYVELTHIYERLQKSAAASKPKEDSKKKKQINPKNPFSSLKTTSTPLSEEQRRKITNFIRRERSKDWTAPKTKNPFSPLDNNTKSRRENSNNPFSPSISTQNKNNPFSSSRTSTMQVSTTKAPASPIHRRPARAQPVVASEQLPSIIEDKPRTHNNTTSQEKSTTFKGTGKIGKPRIAILIEHDGLMMVPHRGDSADDPQVVLNMRLIDSIRWMCENVKHSSSSIDVVIMRGGGAEKTELDNSIFKWKVEYDSKTGRPIYTYVPDSSSTQKRKRSWYSPYARQNETWIETVHPILPNSKVRVVYGKHVGMIGVATEWSSQLKRWKVRLEHDESDKDAETVLLRPDCMEDLNRGKIYVGPPVFYTNKKTRESTTTKPEDFDETATRNSCVASAILKLRGVNSVMDVSVSGTLSRCVNQALDSLKKKSNDIVSRAVFVLTRDSGNARGTSRPIRTTGQVRSRIGDLTNLIGRNRDDVVCTNVIRFSRSPASLPVTPAHYVEEIMCRLTKMTLSSRLSKFSDMICWEIANGEGTPPVLTQWRSESVSRKCKLLMGTLGVGAFGTCCSRVFNFFLLSLSLSLSLSLHTIHTHMQCSQVRYFPLWTRTDV